MSRLSAKGLVLGRRRDSDARIMALDTTMVSSCDAAVGLALGDAGCCSELSFEADTVDCAGGAGRMSRLSGKGVVVWRQRDSDARVSGRETTMGGRCDAALCLALGDA